MLGTKFQKPVKDWKEYSKAAVWANSNSAMIEDKGDFYEVVEAKAPDVSAEEKAAQVRAKRDALLAETDYLLMSDYPIEADKLEEVKVYRQALRDITMNKNFPDVEFPIKPSFLVKE